jgi:hypothetical protein
VELGAIHPRNARRERDEGPHHREQACGEDDDLAAPLEPAIGQLDLLLRDEQVSPVLQDGGPAALGADPVGELRSEVAADGARDRGDDEVEDR